MPFLSNVYVLLGAFKLSTKIQLSVTHNRRQSYLKTLQNFKSDTINFVKLFSKMYHRHSLLIVKYIIDLYSSIIMHTCVRTCILWLFSS